MLALSVPLALGGCAFLRRRRRKPPAAAISVHPVLGPPYQAGGIWRYPRASYAGEETGLAIVAENHGPVTADGAPWDPTALMGAHPTLQLPCVVRVTNLEMGLQILLRLDDRGPDSPARALAITPRAAALLGPGSEPGILRVRITVDEAMSRALTAQYGDLDAPPLAITAAPSQAVQAQDLPPPAGIVGRGATASASTAAIAADSTGPEIPLRLPESVWQLPVGATELFVDVGGLGQRRYAEVLRARLGGLDPFVIRSNRVPEEVAWRVRIGPFTNAAAAEAVLDRVLRAGVVDARIIVE